MSEDMEAWGSIAFITRWLVANYVGDTSGSSAARRSTISCPEERTQLPFFAARLTLSHVAADSVGACPSPTK